MPLTATLLTRVLAGSSSHFGLEGPERGRPNCHTLLGMTAVPSDNHIRAMLDEAAVWRRFATWAGVS